MGRSRNTASLLIAGLALAGLACGRGEPPPDVLLVTIDTLRADRLGAYGDPEAKTPALDRLASRGARFERVSAVTPITLPSHATILTGRYPAAHGVRNNATFVLPPEETTLAEVFRESGWRTAAFVGAYVLSRPFGLDQGFETYDDRFEGEGAVPPPPAAAARGAKPSERRASAVTDAALAWYRSLDRTERAFVWVHYYDPHADYDPPEPFRSSLSDRYRGEIAYTDHEIGRLLEGLEREGRRKRTLVVVTSDHGEAFGEHGETQHGLFVYEPTIRVPLLVALEGRVPPGTVVPQEVSLADVAPTVASLAGVRLPAAQGRDLAPAVIDGIAVEPGDGILIENRLPRLEFGWSELVALRRGDQKYIRAPRPELYDLRSDPEEARNLSASRPEETDAAREALERRVAAIEAEAGEAAARPIDDEALERLRSLGYVGATAPGGSAETAEDALPDPKDRLEEYLATKRATALLAEGRYEEGLALIESILSRDPGNLWMRLEAGRARQFAGDAAGAEAAFREVLLRDPRSCEALYRLGEIAMALTRDLPEAERRLREAVTCDPRRVDALGRLAAVVLARGDAGEARGLLARAVVIAPGDPALRVRLGDLLDDAGDLDGAEREFRAALEADPDAKGAATGLGTVCLKTRRAEEARTWFERAVAAWPDDAVAHANLGAVLLARGERDAAVARLERALELDPSLEPARRALASARSKP